MPTFPRVQYCPNRISVLNKTRIQWHKELHRRKGVKYIDEMLVHSNSGQSPVVCATRAERNYIILRFRQRSIMNWPRQHVLSRLLHEIVCERRVHNNVIIVTYKRQIRVDDLGAGSAKRTKRIYFDTSETYLSFSMMSRLPRIPVAKFAVIRRATTSGRAASRAPSTNESNSWSSYVNTWPCLANSHRSRSFSPFSRSIHNDRRQAAISRPLPLSNE